MASVSKPMHQGRRLFELLEEQHEPFLLDVYLLEHGYSDRALKDRAKLACWPVTARRRLKWLGGYGFKRRRGGILSCVVHKIVCNKLIRKTLSRERAAQGSAKWLGCLFETRCTKCINADEFHRLSYSGVTDGDELDTVVLWRDMEDSRQHSPVSVFDLHSDEDSSVHKHIQEEVPSTSGLNSPGETKRAAPWGDFGDPSCGSSPISHGDSNSRSSNKMHFRQSDHHLLLDCIHELEDKLWRSALCLSPKRIGQIMEEEILSWNNQRGGLTNICQLIELDLTKSRKEWSHFQPDIIEIGVEIEAIIFEEIREESLVDMLCHHCTLQGC